MVEKELSCSCVDQDGVKNLLLPQDDLQLVFVLTTYTDEWDLAQLKQICLPLRILDLKGVSSSKNKDKKVIASHVLLLYAGTIRQPT